MNIVFVCTGNTCRSPMAGALLEKITEDSGDDGVNVITAGISVYVPAKASKNAVAVMDEMDIDISGHISCQIEKAHIEEADLVLTMTSGHRNVLIDLYPEFSGKIYTLCEYAYGKEDDISDPFGGDEYDYRQCAHQLKDAVEKMYSKIKANGGKI